MQARHEYKHSLNQGDYIVLRNRLRHILHHDEHIDENGEYKVRSLYFETPNDKALREKIDGVNKREKFRLRRYIGDSQIIRIEKKSKVNGLCYKRSVIITEDETKKIQSRNLSWMSTDDRELVRELYSKMRSQQLAPKTIVDYIREPFVCKAGNVRITFDRDIRTGIYSTDFLSDDVPTIKAGDEIVILEVKYDQFIPDYILDIIQIGSRRASAISKYALCRIYG
ncbi:MAG: polyphosphate polymerase domain-containing protein [Clostridioides sp.]|jgi:hypothetical protein|nr:polyphosphate polymerase domain-containing protein [Clostridioides sp.]